MNPALCSLAAEHGPCVSCQSLNTRQQQCIEEHLHHTAACQYSRTCHVFFFTSAPCGAAEWFYHGPGKNSSESKDSAVDDDDVQMG